MPGLLVVLILIIGFLVYIWWITHTQGAPWVPMEADVVVRVIEVAALICSPKLTRT